MKFKWELDEKNKRFIDYLLDNEYVIKKVKEYISKTIYYIQKDNVDTEAEILTEVKDIDGYIKLFETQFELNKQLLEISNK